ncbi:hypothetical protein TPA0906_65100 [Streptomyces olivaceus]|nr:hypothetical protein TPA0906_65100 [Streptomyces olivaceus]
MNVSWARRSVRARSTGSAPGSRASHASLNSASPDNTGRDSDVDIVTPRTDADKHSDRPDPTEAAFRSVRPS